MVHPQGSTHRKERRVVPISQQHSCPLYPARRLRSRSGNRRQLRQIPTRRRQLDHPSPPCHDARSRFANQNRGIRELAVRSTEKPIVSSMESISSCLPNVLLDVKLAERSGAQPIKGCCVEGTLPLDITSIDLVPAKQIVQGAHSADWVERRTSPMLSASVEPQR
jgi:hypothetical protein